MGFRLVAKSVTLNDTERRNSPHFALFHRIRYIRRPITSQWLKIDIRTRFDAFLFQLYFGQN